MNAKKERKEQLVVWTCGTVRAGSRGGDGATSAVSRAAVAAAAALLARARGLLLASDPSLIHGGLSKLQLRFSQSSIFCEFSICLQENKKLEEIKKAEIQERSLVKKKINLSSCYYAD